MSLPFREAAGFFFGTVKAFTNFGGAATGFLLPSSSSLALTGFRCLFRIMGSSSSGSSSGTLVRLVPCFLESVVVVAFLGPPFAGTGAFFFWTGADCFSALDLEAVVEAAYRWERSVGEGVFREAMFRLKEGSFKADGSSIGLKSWLKFCSTDG